MSNFDKFFNYIIAPYKVLKNKTYTLITHPMTKTSTNERVFPSQPFNQYIKFFQPPTQIANRIYLGSAFNAASYYTLKEHNIGLIVNITHEIQNYYPDEFTYSQYKIFDNGTDDITPHLIDSYHVIADFIDNTDKNILVHCYMGSSRSAAVVIYYLMKSMAMTFDKALEHVKSKRSSVNLTKKFATELIFL